MGKILIIAAHPDDEILGCGGAITRLTKEGYSAFTLILGEGVTSRDKKRNIKKRENQIEELKICAYKANRIIGVKEIFTHNFPDNRFDSVHLLEIVKVIEEVKNKIKPYIIFTHYEEDLNIDHRITYNAVITAARPTLEETVKEIYSFEILSSTNWKHPQRFSPDTFFDITKTLNNKLEAIKRYKIELRKFPHPRSLKGIELNARYWGMNIGTTYAEAFKLVRSIK